MKMHKVFIKLFNTAAKIPTLGSNQAAGQDLYAAIEQPITIAPGEIAMIPLGIATAMPKKMVGLVFSRSGMVAKQGLRVANGVGVIDSDYRGEWKVLLENCSNQERTIDNGDRIAQVVFLKYNRVVFYPVKDLEDTERGEGGFGSTGK